MATRAYHHGNLREELLDRAEATLAERGLEALSLRELARDVGVSHAAPRRHFADRQELLDALARRGFEHLGVALHAATAIQGDFPERFAAVASAYITFATDHAALLELMFAGKHRAGAEAVLAASDAAFAELFALVAEGQDQGEIEAGDIDRVGVPLFASLHGLAALLNGGMVDPSTRDALVAEVAARALRGVAPRS